MSQFLCSEDGKTIHAWPYCPDCKQPYEFEKEEPFAYCGCGTSEWGDPRPAEWIPAPVSKQRMDELLDYEWKYEGLCK